ncbi:F-box domain containing protein [Tanacetum coccineum]
MNGLPSNIMFDVFSREPAKCLARSRCVSKVWCKYIDDCYLMTVHDQRVKEEPISIQYHSHYSHVRSSHNLCFHIVESKQTQSGTTTDHTDKLKLEPKEDLFLHKKPLSKSSDVQIEFRGSCNGLMCLSQDEDDIVTVGDFSVIDGHLGNDDLLATNEISYLAQIRFREVWSAHSLS